MTDIIYELLGWAGALALLVAYALLSFKKLSGDSYTYQGLNTAGAFMLGLYTIWKAAYASVLVNMIWTCIGAWALWQLWQRKKGGQDA